MNRPRQSPNSRTAILAGAGRAFGRIGYGPCRVEDIIEEAGVSRATFYKCFTSKEDVFDAIEQAFESSFVQAMEGLDSPELTAHERAIGYVDAYLTWLAGWRDVARVLWSDPTRPHAASVAQARQEAFRVFVDLIAELAVDSGLPPDDPLIYRGILAGISEIGLSVIELPHVTDRDLTVARDAILRLAVGALTAEAVIGPPTT